MKKIFLMIVALLSIMSFAYADDDIWDCNFLESNSLVGRDDDVLATVMPKEAMEKAINHLTKYCCDTKKRSKELCDVSNSEESYPESIYLFDHIFDVYLRRLDARQEGENWNDLLYELEPDSDGLAWREYITECGNNVKWLIPLEIKQKYESFWKKSLETDLRYLDNNWLVQDERKQWVIDAINQYDTWTLYDKYNLACDVANYISKERMRISWITTLDEYNMCKDLTDARIANEYTYTQTILVTKADKLLTSNLKAYFGTYFVNNKLSLLLQKIFDINTSFWEVNKAVTKLTDQCS